MNLELQDANQKNEKRTSLHKLQLTNTKNNGNLGVVVIALHMVLESISTFTTLLLFFTHLLEAYSVLVLEVKKKHNRRIRSVNFIPLCIEIDMKFF
jgi:hypothetical protein